MIKYFHPKKGFTLVELIMAVSILSVGIVLVLRSFLSIVTALDSSQNLIKALQFLEAKMSEVRLVKGDTLQKTQGEINIGSRKASWNLELSPLESEDSEKSLEEIKLKVFWLEGNKHRDALLVTLRNKDTIAPQY